MNNLKTNFDQIIEFAVNQGMPVNKKRGILREFLQTKFLVEFYSLKPSKEMSFVGGTSLRLIRGLNRFSEDLDFDNLGLNHQQIKGLIKEVCLRFERENIKVELKENNREEKTYFELRFPSLLYDLKISTNPREKLMIKVDYSDNWKGQKTESVLLSAYGLIEQIVANPIDQVFVQKMTAFVNRKNTEPRDVYDIVWLYAQGARIDKEFSKKNKQASILMEAVRKSENLEINAAFSRRLRPFLFDEKDVDKLKLLKKVLDKLATN